MADRDTMEVYSDYVCPFCYLGKASLDRYRDAHEDAPEPVWRPFDLRGVQRRDDHTLDPFVPDGKDEAYFQRAREGVRRLAEEYGVEMDLTLRRDIDSFPAHLVALSLEHAGDEPALAKWHDAVFDALWRDGRNIGASEVLRELAADIGIDPGRIEQATHDEDLMSELVQRFRSAHAVGVSAVPTFVYGSYAVPGAVPPKTFEALIAHVRKDTSAQA